MLLLHKAAELLAGLEGHGRAAIVEKLRPVRQYLAAAHFAARHALGGRGDNLEIGRDRRADAFHFLQQGRRRAEHLRQRTETGDQRLGDRLGVDARDQPEKQQFEELIVGQGVRAARDEALAQAVAMAVIMRLLCATAFF